MSELYLTIGALVGILLSGGFVYWEIGRFAEPQVPVSRFDERREMFAYTAGLFVGVPIAVAFVLFRLELAIGAVIGVAALLVVLVAGTEAAQIWLVRSRFWGGEARPFYALGFRAAIGGILALTLVASYLAGPVSAGVPLATVIVGAFALVALEVAAAMLSLGPMGATNVRGGSPWSGALVGAVGFFLLGLGPVEGADFALAAALLVLVGSATVYLRLRPLLDGVAVPPAPERPTSVAGASGYGRTEPPIPDGPATGKMP